MESENCEIDSLNYSNLDVEEAKNTFKSKVFYDDGSLGPLPDNWEKAYTEKGEAYFIDHNTGSSHWLDPRLSKFQKKSLEECSDDELPFGWELISDPLFGTYYIDHVNRKTQYENPVLQAKRLVENAHTAKQTFKYNFTRNPDELRGDRLQVLLRKSHQGFGFTIIGGEDNDEFLQIKSIVSNSPADQDGKLQQGDVLVCINNVCVLGFSHREMINIFQSIMPGEYATIDVVRGYPLPFDPEDPNTHIITMLAVDSNSLIDLEHNQHNVDVPKKQQNGYSGINDNFEEQNILELPIYKGVHGFGFTITDCSQGQKVKKIFDNQTYTNIIEGDILLSINNVDVKALTHNQVVEILKDCQTNKEHLIKILRTGSLNYNLRNLNLENTNSKKHFHMFRSKTPTADLYSTQSKTILPIRPKTPLVDTRPKLKGPMNELDILELENSHKLNDATRIVPPFHTNLYKPATNNSISTKNIQPKIGLLPNQIETVDVHDTQLTRIKRNRPPFEAYSDTGSLCADIHGENIYSVASNTCVPDYSNQLYTSRLSFPHENCFCIECQDTENRKMEDYPYGFSPQKNNDLGTRLNKFINDNKIDTTETFPASSNWRTPYKYTSHLDEFFVTEVTLKRQATGFGFRVVGGTEEGCQYVTIGHIIPGGAADMDGRIASGDEIQSIDGISVKNASHHQVVQLMAEAALKGHVTLLLKRRIPRSFKYPYNVTVTRNHNESFGFVIISSSSQCYGSTIGKLIPGSPAERSGELKIGDYIVAVNGININALNHGDVVNLIKDSGLEVQLTIGNPKENINYDPQCKDETNRRINVSKHYPLVC